MLVQSQEQKGMIDGCFSLLCFFSWTRVVFLYQCVFCEIGQENELETSWFSSLFFPGGCFIVESDVPQPDFKHDVFIGSAQQLTKHL